MSELLACPECENQRFSWIVEQVQFGNVHEFDSGARDGEGLKMGEVTDSDIDTNGAWCLECDEFRDLDELVIVDE